jgi:hypothetical protein
VIKDASHPDFASQSKPPPSGPSKRVLAHSDHGDSPKGVPTGPRAKIGVPPSPDVDRPMKSQPLPPPSTLRARSPPPAPVSNGIANARRTKIEQDRNEAISLRDQVRDVRLLFPLYSAYLMNCYRSVCWRKKYGHLNATSVERLGPHRLRPSPGGCPPVLRLETADWKPHRLVPRLRIIPQGTRLLVLMLFQLRK